MVRVKKSYQELEVRKNDTAFLLCLIFIFHHSQYYPGANSGVVFLFNLHVPDTYLGL